MSQSSVELTHINAPGHEDESTPARLRDRLFAVLREHVPPGPVSLVGFPAHQNVGDLAIWLGELKWLDVAGYRISYVCSQKDYSAARLRERAPVGSILLHGGGNMGDLYPHHERVRRQVLVDFPDRTVVQLPQTIHFRHVEEMRESARVYRSHPDFRLLVRDHRSAQLAESQLRCDPVLCPDAAFGLGPVSRARLGTGLLALLREDREALGKPFVGEGSQPRTDWPRGLGLRSRPIYTLTTRLARLSRASGGVSRLTTPLICRGYKRFAQQIVERGLSILSDANVVVTDRLHGHILCLLLGVRNVILDNSYGKLSAFYETWTAGSPLARRADDLASAVEVAEQW